MFLYLKTSHLRAHLKLVSVVSFTVIAVYLDFWKKKHILNNLNAKMLIILKIISFRIAPLKESFS